jgi:hypothetical protein
MKNNKHDEFLSRKSATNFFLKYFTLAILTTIVLSGCGNGGGGGSSTASGANVLGGTAAAGAPLANGTVTLKDSAGATATTTADANGNYSFDVSAKRFPLMLKVQPNITGAAPLFSAALTSGTANTTPLTTLQIFEAVGRTDPSIIYDTGDFSNIGKSSLNYAKLTVTSNFSILFASNGLDPTSHDPITTSMVADGVGMDAILDQTNVAILGNDASLTDYTGRCLDYGPLNVVTFSIDGMALADWPAFFGFPFPVDINGIGMSDEYVKNALVKVCVPGIDKPRPMLVPNYTNPNIMASNITWTRNPSLQDTIDAVTLLKTLLSDAYTRNKLATERGGMAGPINIVAHSWGGVIAYIALSELETEGSPIKVANLISMGTPVQCLTGDCLDAVLDSVIQPSVPSEFQRQPIRVPSNIATAWINFWGHEDMISARVNVPGVKNRYVDCQGYLYGDISAAPTIHPCASLLTYGINHGQYFTSPIPGTDSPTLVAIRALVSSSHAETAPMQTTQPPIPATVALPPSAFTLSGGSPYCDSSNPPGPAVNLAWSASDGAVYYRVFRDGSAVGVNLNASQLSFLNNLGLVAGQVYSYKAQAINANGTTWSDVVQVTIPAAVCGSVTDPKITVGPATINFGNVAVGSCGTATFVVQHVMGTNPASGTVSVGPNPPFSITSSSSFSVSNGSAANVSVQFCPTSPLTYTGTATVTSSATFTGTNSVTLSGTGMTQITLPAAPSALTANALSQSNIALTWQDNSDNETGFKIERKTGTSGTFAQIATVGPISGVGSGGYYEDAGLTAATTYCYRTRASNTAGDSSYTSESCATTQQVPVITPPTATTSPATNVTSNSATLNGTVNPNGTASGAFFQWGTTISYGNLTPNDTSPGSGTTAQPVLANITGLSPNTIYHFRIVASSGPNTTVFGADQSFTTGSFLKQVTVANLSGGLLMLRSGPGLSYSIITTLPEGTTMGVIGGPTLADGFTWWNISGTSGTGWSAVGEWLTPPPQIGATVTVSYTGGAGLKLSSTASLSGTVITTLPEGAQMSVFGGPVLANGYTWWAIQGVVSGTSYTGWSGVGDWLTPNPRY